MPQMHHGCNAAPQLTLLAPPSLAACLKLAEGVAITTAPLPSGLYWQFETDGGTAIDLPLAAIRVWERSPFCMLIRLVPSRPGHHPVQEAVVGTRLGLGELQAKIVATMLILLRAARRGHGRSAVARLGASAPATRRTGLLAGLLRRTAHRVRDWVLVEEWAIGLVRQPIAALLGGEPLQPAAWLPSRPGINLADPHPRPGSNQIMCEEFGVNAALASARGRIICLDLDRDEAAIGRSRLILGGDLHRSYPGVSQSGPDTVFLPETPARGATELFRLREDDTLERLCRIGLPLRMADPTLFEHGGRFWIAYTDLDIGEHDNLCLMHATALAGPWTPHQANPVKLDVRAARPAGPVIAHAGHLYRPAQDCAASYGAALVINRIEELTPERFSEVAVQSVRPALSGRYPHGLHTVAARGNGILIDGKRRVFRSRVVAGKLRRRLRPTRGAAA